MESSHVRTVILVVLATSLVVFKGKELSFTVSTLGHRSVIWPKNCIAELKSVPEPYSQAYQRRNQVIDLNGVQYAAYKWDGKIEWQDFDDCMDTHTDRIQFKIYDSKLYVNGSNLEWKNGYAEDRYIKIVEPLLMAIHMYQIPNMDFWVELSDTLECGHPVFTYSLNTECEQAGFTVPSYGAYNVSFGTRQLDFAHRCLDANHPYNRRIPKGVWRGSTTGSILTKENYMENRRVRLSRMAQNRTDIMDVGLYAYVQADAEAQEKLQEVVPIVPSIRMEDYNEYALILDLDGNGWSDRFTKLITYNTPMLKQTSIFQEYFAHLMQPGVHIEMFDPSLADLVPKLEELLQEYKASQKRLRRMAETMHKFALDHGSHLGLIRAVAYGLTVYASKLTWKTEMESGFVEVNRTTCCTKNPTFPAKFIQDVRSSAGAPSIDVLSFRKLHAWQVLFIFFLSFFLVGSF